MGCLYPPQGPRPAGLLPGTDGSDAAPGARAPHGPAGGVSGNALPPLSYGGGQGRVKVQAAPVPREGRSKRGARGEPL